MGVTSMLCQACVLLSLCALVLVRVCCVHTCVGILDYISFYRNIDSTSTVVGYVTFHVIYDVTLCQDLDPPTLPPLLHNGSLGSAIPTQLPWVTQGSGSCVYNL